MYLKIIFLVYLLFLPVIAFDMEDFGDFSSRSTIMNSLQGKERLSQEQKDLLKEKKLIPNSQCLFEQIKKGHIENVSILLDSKVNPNETYYSDYPIYYAAKLNKFEIVKLLYERGAKLDKGFYSELYEAVRNKNKDMAEFLLDKGARVNYTDSITNNTILSMSLSNNMIDIACELIKKGAKIDNISAKIIKKKKLYYLIEEKCA